MSAPIAPVGAAGSLVAGQGAGLVATRPVTGSFAQMLSDGIQRVDDQLRAADAQVTRFALDDSIPPHEVMFALEQARHGLQLLLQVRAQLVEGLQDIMRIQL